VTRSKQRQRKKQPPAVQVRDAPGYAAFSGAYPTVPSGRRRPPASPRPGNAAAHNDTSAGRHRPLTPPWPRRGAVCGCVDQQHTTWRPMHRASHPPRGVLAWPAQPRVPARRRSIR
jgi:hypothetical protein